MDPKPKDLLDPRDLLAHNVPGTLPVQISYLNIVLTLPISKDQLDPKVPKDLLDPRVTKDMLVLKALLVLVHP